MDIIRHYRYVLFCIVLYCGFCTSVCLGRVTSSSDHDYIIITVCNVPSIIIFKDKKVIRTMPITVFFSLKRYEKISTKITNTPKENINHLDAAKWTIKPTPCGISI